ncbi:hypothetical protein GCM10010378_45280 [Streptomyces viridochromogenes]
MRAQADRHVGLRPRVEDSYKILADTAEMVVFLSTVPRVSSSKVQLMAAGTDRRFSTSPVSARSAQLPRAA